MDVVELDEYPEDQLSQLATSLRSIMEKVDNGEDLMEHLKGKRVETNLVSNAAGTSSLLLDMWYNGKKRNDVVETVEKAVSTVEKIVERKRKYDMLDDVVTERIESGCVYVPTDLLLNMWALGEEASSMLQGKSNGFRLMDVALRVIYGTVDWITFCKRRWGMPSDSVLVMVVPISKEDVMMAYPDDPQEKVPF